MTVQISHGSLMFGHLNNGSSLCLVPVSTGHVAMQTRIQDWTRVRILTGPLITDHWTEAQPLNNQVYATL